VSNDEFQHRHTGLDGLAEADIICDEQVDPWHLDGPDDRIKLVVLDLDAGAEGSLDVRHVGGRGGTPADGIQKGIEAVGRINAGGFR
jgi:hypothetical protein